ncbi:cytochrome c [uncultured Croceitalea sp.]|uniref:c-type cytochrome n=1 Tax=uncultured Croceitalea sp. TaxID=1798908 RepID=UPI00330644B7
MRYILIPLLFLVFGCKENYQLTEAYDRGKEVYITNCISCHGSNGAGNLLYPPINSRIANAMTLERAVSLILQGSQNMPSVDLTDQEITDVLNYIQNSWGLEAEIIPIDSIISFKSISKNAAIYP